MEIKILSRISDRKINALNVLIEIRIKDYLSIANQILTNNELQRKKVKSSKSVYSLLRNDLKSGCTIPPIFLAVRKEAVGSQKKLEEIEKITDKQIITLIEQKKLLILDGLQRTYQIIELEQELKKGRDSETLAKFLARPLRAEVFIGINKIGILYRMLTLNTGQTPMSVRHQIEILYQDYLGEHKIDGIEIIREVEGGKAIKLGKYKFSEVVDGFQSYLEKDELAIDRGSLLEDVKTLEKLSKVGQKKELFQSFVLSYHHFLSKIITLGKKWELEEDDAFFEAVPQPFALDVETLFLRSQVITGFGAAIGSLEDAEKLKDIDYLLTLIAKIKLGDTSENTFEQLLTNLETIRKTSKKIGNSQRRYFYFFFKALFNDDGDAYLNVKKAIDKAFQNYKVEFL
ncbi:hypothetical protein [Agriterribacter humi]|uniref:hypothetical protein n=1 Tax=Agriterribacter humi TaxID=1104781 RepID=UPI001263EB03|nr:hypothetical protein [Agriterribacter humi]